MFVSLLMFVPRSFFIFRSFGRRGETLVEVLAAFFVLAVTSTAITVYVAVSGHFSRLINDQLIAHISIY